MVNYCIRVGKRERENCHEKSANALLVDAQSSLITNGSKSTVEVTTTRVKTIFSRRRSAVVILTQQIFHI